MKRIKLPKNIDKKLKAESLKGSLYEFFLEAFKVLHHGQEPSLGWHMREMCDDAQSEIERIIRREKREKHRLWNVPPRSSKSLIWSICAPAWAWTIAPELNFITVCYTDSLALKLNGKCRDLIESSWYREHFPYVKIKRGENKKSEFKNTVGGNKWATSMKGAVTGDGADVIIFDDPMNPEIAGSDIKRTSYVEKFKKTFQSRLNNPDVGSFFVIEQRLHEGDISGYIIGNIYHKYKHVSIPATDDGNIVPAHYRERYHTVEGQVHKFFMPSRFTPEVLEDQKLFLGSYEYAGQYLQTPSPPEGGILKKHWFNIVPSERFYKITLGVPRDLYIDGAETDRSENDATAVLVGFGIDNIFYIEKVYEFRLEQPDALREIQKIHDEHCSVRSQVYIEPKSSGLGFLSNLRKYTSMNVKEDRTLKRLKNASKKERVKYISPMVESKRVTLCEGGYVKPFLDQCADFPNAKHDDQVDTLVMGASNCIKRKARITI